MRQLTQDEFLERVKEIFPNYNFSKAIYKGINYKVQVGCEHGYWWSTPGRLFRGHSGCKKCFRIKYQHTMNKRYGVDTPLQLKEFEEKKEKTLLERYGVEHAIMLPSVREKICSQDAIEQRKQTLLNRYGVEYPLQSSEFKEKKTETMLKRYGKKSLGRRYPK